MKRFLYSGNLLKVRDYRIISMMFCTTLFITAVLTVPVLRTIIVLSPVKMRAERINDDEGNDPSAKSVFRSGTAKRSRVCCDVIWQSSISLPERSANTKAGRLLEPDKSENGNGITTMSPFINVAMRDLLRESTNLLLKPFHLQNES